MAGTTQPHWKEPRGSFSTKCKGRPKPQSTSAALATSANVVAFDMLTKEVQHNHNQNNRVQQVQNRCCNADDCRDTEVGYDVAECNSQDNYLCIGNLVVCQLCEIGCAGGGQTDCCGQAGKEYDDCQNQYAVAADQRLCDCNNQPPADVVAPRNARPP